MDIRYSEERVALPPLSLQSPVLAMLAARDGLWAGGIGAVAHRAIGADGWTRCPSLSTLRMVLTLAEGGTTLFAGGVGGVQRSVDRGVTWTHGRGTEHDTIQCLAISPRYADDETILAGTASSGVMRSTDGGTTWAAARFGLQASDVSNLIWLDGNSIVANTSEGVYQSANSGRSWKRLGQQVFPLMCQGTVGLLAIDGQADLWQSGNGDSWLLLGSLPDGVEPQALAVAPTGEVLVGTVDRGVLMSADGKTWATSLDDNVLTFTVGEHDVFAGTETGVMALATGTHSWQPLGSPPLADYDRLLAFPGGLLASGILTPPQRWSDSDGWRTLDACPVPLKVVTTGWDGELLVVTGDGLYASTDDGETWHVRSAVPGGDFLTIRADGAGWMATAEGSTLLVTHDRGHTWVPLKAPFGVFQVVALQAAPEVEDPLLLAVSFDPRQQSTTLWRSHDDGLTWTRGREAHTTWPEVSTLAEPLAVTVGDALILRGPDGVWMRTQPSPGAHVRQITASEAGLVARTQNGVWLLRTNDREWSSVSDLPAQVAAVCLDGDTLFVLGNGGEVSVLNVAPA